MLKACADERGETVRSVLTSAFRRYGLPAAMLMDNGAPWGSDHDHPFTAFSLWLIRLGIRVAHSRAYHPQTQGKDERFHRTLKFEVLRHFNFTTLEHCQREFDYFRERYNLVRPHDALGLATPASYYRPSPIPFPEHLPPVEYPPGLRCARCKPRVGLPIADATFASARPCADSPSPCVKSISATPVVRFSSAIRWSPSSTSITLFIPTHDLNERVTYVLARSVTYLPSKRRGLG